MPDVLEMPYRPDILGAGAPGELPHTYRAALVARGFVTSRVLVEPQQLADGRLRLSVIPGRIRQVRFAGPAARHPSVLTALPARPGDVLDLRDVEQALENLRRVPTVEADIEIVPADDPGLSDLLVHWTQQRPLRLELSVDDSGSRATGLSITLSGPDRLIAATTSPRWLWMPQAIATE